jgi:LAO/AO transport system kinase
VIARAATAIENRTPGARRLLRELFPHTGRALTVGITGPPGAGKSTLLNALTAALREKGRRTAVIAVDPTSPFTGGAILGDRVRMTDHHADSGVFIRSMATRGQLGGLAAATSDLALLLDAAGFDIVLIETVGVGQDEVDIARVADVTALVLVPGMGDDVQAIKAGIMEIADIFILNKADRPGVEKLERELHFLLSLATRKDGWQPPVIRCVATDSVGVVDTLEALDRFVETGLAQTRSAPNWAARLEAMYRERAAEKVRMLNVNEAANEVAARRTDPFTVVEQWLNQS